MRLAIRFSVLIIVAASNVAADDRVDAPFESKNRNVIAASIRAEEAMLAPLRRGDERPLVEAVVQRHAPDGALGYAIAGDTFELGRFQWSDGPALESLSVYPNNSESSWFAAAHTASARNVLSRLAAPDWDTLSPQRYEYTYVETTLLGALRVFVFDVKPRSGQQGGFYGRVFIESRDYAIVRASGGSREVDAAFNAYLDSDASYRFDIWRVHVRGHRFVPAYAYVEEAPAIGAPDRPVFKMQIRYWGFAKPLVRAEKTDTAIVVDTKSAVIDATTRWPSSPQESQRLFERRAEDNVITSLFRRGLLDTPGSVDAMLEQVLRNISARNRLVLATPPRARVLVTTRFEALHVNDTVLISRGLLDVMPDESCVALILAHQLSHLVLGHRKIDTKLGFPDVLDITDAVLLERLRFRHTLSEELAADAKAMELLERSDYAKDLPKAGLFMQSLEQHATRIPGLLQPHFGEHVADRDHTVRNNANLRVAPDLDAEDPGQIAALPLGSRLVMSPWDARLTPIRPQLPLALALREKMPFAVTPFNPFLEYAPEPQASEPPSPSASGKTAAPLAKRGVKNARPARRAATPARRARSPRS